MSKKIKHIIHIHIWTGSDQRLARRTVFLYVFTYPKTGGIALSSIADDSYNKLMKNIGNDFSTRKENKITELYSFRCRSCGYKNIHNFKNLICGCGEQLEGNLVYRKIEDTVVYDIRQARRKRY